MKKTSHKTPPPVDSTTKPQEPEESQEPAVPPIPQDEISVLKAQVDQYRDQSLRAAADLENYRKRMIREKEDIVRYANSTLLEKLIPIIDNFELGLDAARSSADTKGAEIINGLAMVQRQLSDFLKDHGIQPIDAVNQPFDPKLHDAIGHEVHDDIAEGTVISQMRKGYRLADRLIRPASVIVSKGSKE